MCPPGLWVVTAQISFLFYTWSCTVEFAFPIPVSFRLSWVVHRMNISIQSCWSPSPFDQYTRQVHLQLRTHLQAGSHGDANPCPYTDFLSQTDCIKRQNNWVTEIDSLAPVRDCNSNCWPKMYILDNGKKKGWVWADEWWPTDDGSDVAWLSRPKCVNLSNLGPCFHLCANLCFRASLGTWHQSGSHSKLSWKQLQGSAARGWPLLVMAATQEHGGGLQLWGRPLPCWRKRPSEPGWNERG